MVYFLVKHSHLFAVYMGAKNIWHILSLLIILLQISETQSYLGRHTNLCINFFCFLIGFLINESHHLLDLENKRHFTVQNLQKALVVRTIQCVCVCVCVCVCTYMYIHSQLFLIVQPQYSKLTCNQPGQLKNQWAEYEQIYWPIN